MQRWSAAGDKPMTFRLLDLLPPRWLGTFRPKSSACFDSSSCSSLNLANAVVSKLRELRFTLFGRQVKALGDVVQLLRDLAEDFFGPADGVLKDADTPQTALVDVAIDGARRDEVDDGDRLALLSVAVDTADALLDAHGVPGQIVVDEEIAELEVEALAADFGGQQHIQRVGIVFGQRKAAAQLGTIFVGTPPWISPQRSPARWTCRPDTPTYAERC